MGFLDAVLGVEKSQKKVHNTGKPFNVSMKFVPIRLSSGKEGKMDLEIQIENATSEYQLVSVDALLPKQVMIGFDPTGINKHIEKRLGEIKPAETKTAIITIWSNSQTKEGEYPIEITFYSHYLEYNKVLNYIKKKLTIRVV
jgi:uncharacterized membrane protein